MEPEVAAAYDYLYTEGSVLHLESATKILRKWNCLKICETDVEINQLQFSIMASGMVDLGINVNTRLTGRVRIAMYLTTVG